MAYEQVGKWRLLQRCRSFEEIRQLDLTMTAPRARPPVYIPSKK